MLVALTHATLAIAAILADEVDRRGTDAEAWFRKCEAWYWKAGDLGHTNAMINLGGVLRERGNITEAKDRFLKAAGIDEEEED